MAATCAKGNRWDRKQVAAVWGANVPQVEATELVEQSNCVRRVTISGFGFGANPVVVGRTPMFYRQGAGYPVSANEMVIYLEPGERLYCITTANAQVVVNYRVEEIFDHSDSIVGVFKDFLNRMLGRAK